jgi:hypothetical protein
MDRPEKRHQRRFKVDAISFTEKDKRLRIVRDLPNCDCHSSKVQNPYQGDITIVVCDEGRLALLR